MTGIESQTDGRVTPRDSRTRKLSGALALRLGALEQIDRRDRALVVLQRAEGWRDRRTEAHAPGTSRLTGLRTMCMDDTVLDAQRDLYRAGEPGPSQVVSQLIAAAENTLGRPTYSVTAKTEVAPSGDKHDYWSAAPYWWPNPDSPDGLPYVWRDGQRRPGTALWEPGSERYDRSSLQSMIDETTVATLAGYFAREKRYFARGADLLRTWFLAPSTRANPHLRYAQVRRGRANGQGAHTGVVEAKDLHYLVDAAVILEREEVLRPSEVAGLRSWFEQYRTWLEDSEQGRRACAASNNHATWYDVQVAAICGYLDDVRGLMRALRRIPERMRRQFEPDGRQPAELERATPQHYCLYNAQGWLSLAQLAGNVGQDVWSYRAAGGRQLRPVAERLLEHPNDASVFGDHVNPERLAVLHHHLPGAGLPDELLPGGASPWHTRQVFTATEGIRPFWVLGKPDDR